MELKTLKDLNIAYASTGYRTDKFAWGGKAVRIDELKAEAIKWVKKDKEWTNEFNSYDSRSDLSYLLTRWMKRFNITEEDLQ